MTHQINNSTLPTHPYRRGRKFHEQQKRHRMNRRLAKSIRARPAVLADGTPGVAINYGDDLLVLSHSEAIDLTNLIVDTLEAT